MRNKESKNAIKSAEDINKPKKNIFKTIFKWWVLFWILMIIVVIVIGCIKTSNENANFTVLIIHMLVASGMLGIGSLVINVIMLIDMFKKAKAYNRYLEENKIDEQAEETAFKTYINHTRYNQDATAFRAVSMWLRAINNSPKNKSSYINLFLIILFFCCCISFIILSACGLITIALICLGLGFAIILTLLLIHLVHKKVSTNNKNIDFNAPAQLATVKSCVISDESTYTSGSHYSTQTNRILSTTYLVYLDVDGKEKRAYSKNYYNKGDKVYVYPNKKLKNMVIITDKDN